MPTEESPIEKKLVHAYQRLVKSDFDLFLTKVNERSITHKLAEYLQDEFPEYHVDCEYNRDLLDEKVVPPWEEKMNELMLELERLDTTEKRKERIGKILEGEVSVYPDIIVHRRRTRDNFIVIEAKKVSTGGRDNTDSDKQKLKSYKSKLGYKKAYFVSFPIDRALESFTEDSIDQLIDCVD